MAPHRSQTTLKTLVLASVGLLSISQSQAVLQCYECNSAEQPDCSLLQAHNHTNLLKPCLARDPQQQPFCRKIYQTIHRRGGLEVVIRRCGWVRDDDRDCYRVRNLDHAETVCQCFTDGCNAAPSLARMCIFTLITIGVIGSSTRLFFNHLL